MGDERFGNQILSHEESTPEVLFKVLRKPRQLLREAELDLTSPPAWAASSTMPPWARCSPMLTARDRKPDRS